jgi:hypothetical protein
VREYHYVVDREGRIFHDGTEIVDPAVLRFFLRVMQRTDDDRYLVLCQGERNWFAADDTPYVVQRLRVLGPPASPDGPAAEQAARDAERVELIFAGAYTETLDPATLEIEDGRLRCRIRGGITACFGRVAMQQLAPLLLDAPGAAAAIALNGMTYRIRERGDATIRTPR